MLAYNTEEYQRTPYKVSRDSEPMVEENPYKPKRDQFPEGVDGDLFYRMAFDAYADQFNRMRRRNYGF